MIDPTKKQTGFSSPPSVAEARARLATLQETACALGISMPTVRRRVADGSIKVVRIGPRVIRVSASELARLMGETATTAEA